MTRFHPCAAGTIAPFRPLRLAGVLVGLFALSTSHAAETSAPNSIVVAAADAGAARAKPEELRMWMTVGQSRFNVTMADTDAAREFAAQLPLTLDMSDLNGNEKKFDLPKNLPANPHRPGTIRNGDLMLWGDNTVVVFYKTFDSPYSYTRLGRVSDPTGLALALGRDGVRVRFSAQP